MKKIGVIALTLVLALGIIGVGYALWAENLYITGTVTTGEVDWEFYNIADPLLPPTVTQEDTGYDPPLLEKDVASSTWSFEDSDGDGDFDKLNIFIVDAYPLYYNHYSTWVHCNGSVPIIIVGAYVSFDGGATEEWMIVGEWVTSADGALRVNFGDNYGNQLHFCDSRNVSFAVQVLQPAQQNTTYTFSIRYVAVQYNEYTPGP